MAKYQRKVLVVVDATQLPGPLMVAGTQVAAKGDWLVTAGSGDSFIMVDEEFRTEYEPVADPAPL